MDSFDIMKYVEMLLRRKYWIIIPFLLTVLAGMTYALTAQKIFEATTLILVQPQKVPQDFVRAIVSSDIEDRLRTITQQVTSRTNVEKIIQEYRLYLGHPESKLLIDEKVELFRERVKIDVARSAGTGGSAFTISFRGKDPEKTMQVTNAMASNFISENLKIRESQALGTSSFLSDELESVKTRLSKKEEDLKKYRESYMGGLPEQLQTNLSILERLESRLAELNASLRDAENRKIVVQGRANEQTKFMAESRSLVPSPGEGKDPTDIRSLRSQLSAMEARYTKNHPDVIRLRKTIENLEAQLAESSPSSPDTPDEGPAVSNEDQRLTRQIQSIEVEIKGLRSEVDNTKMQINWYRKKVEETPKREQELLSLKRDYDNLKELYNSLLNRKLEAELAVSMEKKQKGEQFRVIDPAKIPMKPVSPDMRKVILLTIILGLGLGLGLAFLLESMDSSFKTADEVKRELNLPILIGLPIRYTDHELRRARIKSLLLAVAIPTAFIISAIGIFVAVRGLDNTLNRIRSVLSGM